MATSAEQLHHYLARAQNYYDRTPETKARFPDAQSAEFRRHVDVEAVLYLRELQEVAPPLPSWQQMLTVGGETDARSFLSVGYDCFVEVRKHLGDSSRKRRVLDFGVGCARTMRHFFRELDSFDCFGCDVDVTAIDSLHAYPFITGVVSHNLPPLIFRDGFFDAIYCISVFTHLNAAAFARWVSELRRVLSPDGVFITSMHGMHAFAQVDSQPARRKLIGLDEAEFQAARNRFLGDEFLWLRQPAGSTDIDTTQYGISFTPDALMASLFAPHFKVEARHVGALQNWQDLIVLRPA